MSSEHIHSVYNTKKLKLDDVTEIESCIAEYKRRDFEVLQRKRYK